MKCEFMLFCVLLLAAQANARSVREVKDNATEVENLNISPAESAAVPLAKCSCDWRYLKHYATKKCTPVFEEGCECPVRFDCPETPAAADVCEYKGKTYQIGEAIETPNDCDICSCSKSYLGVVELSCIPIECPSVFRPPLEEGCYEVYEEGKCCSVETKCVNEESQENVTVPTCQYGNRIYRKGERIYPEEDPCMSCLCDENWAGVNSTSCHIHECLMERHAGDLRRGCIPIYHEKTCCPIEFHCGSDDESSQNDTLVPKTGSSCIFDKKSYGVGEELDIKHPTHCVTCTCNTPPDFTCVHTSCPRPPNDDYDNCRPIYHDGACCPEYDCQPPPAPLVCLPVNCVNGCTEVWTPDGCSICLCNQTLCAPPLCPEDCPVEYNVPDGTCPHCKCPATVQFAPVQCAPVNCDSECFEAVGPNGCTTCICGHICTPPKCDDSCYLETDVPRGQCPRCVCPSTSEDGPQIQCSPVKCTPACREVIGQYGCPTCLCGPLCSPPRCDPGCEVETVPSSGPCPGCVCRGDQPSPLFDIQCSPPKCDPGCEVKLVSGPCPSCVCNGEQTSGGVQCAPVKCAPTCREVIQDSGCPTCVCDVLCSPPKCDPGCEIETAPFSGPCPGCVCDGDVKSKSSDIQCAPVKCDPTCREVIGPSECPICLCGPICDPPKCDPGCEIEAVPSSGPCPGCVCGGQKKGLSEVQCAPVKCGPLCRQTEGDFGCPVCVCDPQCSPPKCDPGCEIETAPFSGPCPGCVCKKEQQVPEILCSPPKCDPGCEVKLVSGPCPSCVCKGDQNQSRTKRHLWN